MERLYFLDNLKTCIVVLMVVFHAAMSYMAYAPEWWSFMRLCRTWLMRRNGGLSCGYVVHGLCAGMVVCP